MKGGIVIIVYLVVVECRARRALLGVAERAHTARPDATHCTDAAPVRRWWQAPQRKRP